MTLEEMVSKYIKNTERIFHEIRLSPSSVHIEGEMIKGVVEEAKRYLKDAKHYQEINKFDTSLASVAYCEGLLDALRMLRIVEFSW